MASLPADEDYARAILSIFQRVRPRHSMRAGEVKAAFLSRNMGRAEDFDAAVDYAARQGWISVAFDSIRLTPPGGEDYARAVLSIFQGKGVHPRQSMRVGEVKAAFLSQNMGRAEDFDAAVDYAGRQGWLSVAFGSIRLTGPGDEEMHTVPEFWPVRPRRLLPLFRSVRKGLVRSRGLEPPLRLKN